MVSTVDEKCKDEIQEDFETEATSNAYNNNNQIPLHIRISQEGNRDGKIQTNKFLDMIRKTIAVSGSPTAKFRQIALGRDEFSRSIASPVQQSLPGRFPTRLVRKIKWEPIKGMFWEWIKNPMNMALFLWIVCVAISGAVLFMVMTGMLNDVLTKKSQRNIWFEVSNQILNALFTLMCLYQHPKRFHHLALLCRWKPKDVLTLRKIYCKNGSYKPNEWMHMMVVVALLHINCFAQYALCGLNLGFRRSKRPAIGVGVCISLAIAATAVAAVYNILSPLGKEYDLETDYEAHIPTTVGERKPARTTFMSPEKEYSFVSRDGGATENRPVWIGGLFDFWDEIYLAYPSIFCSFCVFGWNMDRLGFGNMYVHITTFILLCMAPFWIFNLAAITIDNETIRVGLGLTGIVLCVFGLLYGGFWRIQMRRRFKHILLWQSSRD